MSESNERLKQLKMSRRKFLDLGIKTLFAGLFVSKIGSGENTSAQESAENIVTREVPPSIMLHSDYNHERILPGIITELRNQGYVGITYLDLLSSFEQGTDLPEKPVIISVDDLTMATGAAYDAFSRFKDIFVKNDFAGVFAVNTQPGEAQDEERWNDLVTWSDGAKIEFATHTATHTNLNRVDINIDHIRAEVTDSAEEIRRRTGQEVPTLILPFGAGYDMNTGIIRPEIVTVCQESGIKFIVGIAGGREPVRVNPDEENPVYLLGRVGPGARRGEETEATAVWEVKHW